MSKKETQINEIVENTTIKTEKRLEKRGCKGIGETKKCRKCKEILQLDSFYKCKDFSSGYMATCKNCHNKRRNKGNKNYKPMSKFITDSNGKRVPRSKNVSLIGLKFNKLTVIGDGETIKKKKKWRCQCDCGNYTEANTSELNNSYVKSCGCLKAEILTLPLGIAAQNLLFRIYKNNARRNKREFKLSKETFLKLTSSDCYYCGCKPSQSAKNYYSHCNGDYL